MNTYKDYMMNIICISMILGLFVLAAFPKLREAIPIIKENHKAQVISVDFEGNKLWRVDIGLSDAFNKFDIKYNTTGMINDLRKVQVLEIYNNEELRIIK